VTASSTSRGRARIVAGSALVAGVAALLALSACGAGQLAQTARQQSAIAGVNGEAAGGLVSLRNALIPFSGPQGYDQGGTAPIAVTIANNGLNTVKLVDVTSTAASDVVLVGGPAAATTAPPKTSAAASPTGSASPGASPAATTAPPPAAPPGQTSFSVAIDSGSYVVLMPQNGTYLELVGLQQPLPVGSTVAVVFKFDDGSSTTLNLPVGPATAAVPRVPPVVTQSPGE
jgi:copper(I)-binding protein